MLTACWGKSLNETTTIISPISKEERESKVLVGISIYYQAPYGILGHTTQSISRISVAEIFDASSSPPKKDKYEGIAMYGEDENHILVYNDSGSIYPYYFFIADRNKNYGIRSLSWLRFCGNNCYQEFSASLNPKENIVFDPNIKQKIYFAGIYEIKLTDPKSEGFLSTKATFKPKLIDGTPQLRNNPDKHKDYIESAYGGTTISDKNIQNQFFKKILENGDYYWQREVQNQLKSPKIN